MPGKTGIHHTDQEMCKEMFEILRFLEETRTNRP